MNESELTRIYSFSKYSEPGSDIEKTVKLMTCLVLGGFGIFGNVFVIVLAVKYTARKCLHFLITYMAVSNSLFVFVDLFHFISTQGFLPSAWVSSGRSTFLILRKIFMFWYVLFLTETLLTLLIISIERHRVTRRTVQISRPLSAKRHAAIAAGSWLISVGVLIPFHHDGIYFFTALTLIFFLYLSMILFGILTLRRIHRPKDYEYSPSEAKREEEEKQNRNSVKKVLWSLLLYSCCHGLWIFSTMFMILNDSIHCIERSTIAFFVIYFLPLVNVCFSPGIYCVCLSDFREATMELIVVLTNNFLH